MMTILTPQLHVLPTIEELGEAAAVHVSRLSAEAVAARERFIVALSGGSLIRLLCPPLVTESRRSQIEWSAWHVFWADERCVPLTDADSNYRVARETLFDLVNIPQTQIHPIDDTLDPVAAAGSYQSELARTFRPGVNRVPRFDLILLGVGEDGHTASLFPGHPLLEDRERWVVPVLDSPKPPPERITLTLPVINAGRQVVFLAAGGGKAAVLRQLLDTGVPPGALPAQMVRPAEGEVHWFVDEAAGGNLVGR